MTTFEEKLKAFRERTLPTLIKDAAEIAAIENEVDEVQVEQKDELIECEACPNKIKESQVVTIKMNGNTAKVCKQCAETHQKEYALQQAHIEAEKARKSGERAKEDIEKETEHVVDVDALYTESLAASTTDAERFRKIFTNTIQQKCLGHSVEEIQEMLREAHEVLFDVRAGIQGMLAYRKQLLKDATSEEREKILKSDWLHKPTRIEKTDKVAKKVLSEEEKQERAAEQIIEQMRAKGYNNEKIKAKLELMEIDPPRSFIKAIAPKQPKKSMDEIMIDAMRAKGLSADEIKKRMIAFKGED
jgi:hypothetical protein